MVDRNVKEFQALPCMCCGVWLTRNNMIFEEKSKKSDLVTSYNPIKEGWKVKIKKTFRIIKAQL